MVVAEGPRTLFNRAVVWLIGSQVLLPGITTLAPMVAEVRREENGCTPRCTGPPHQLRTKMGRRLEVPEKRRVSELERLQLRPMRISGRAMQHARSAPRRCGMVPAGLTA